MTRGWDAITGLVTSVLCSSVFTMQESSIVPRAALSPSSVIHCRPRTVSSVFFRTHAYSCGSSSTVACTRSHERASPRFTDSRMARGGRENHKGRALLHGYQYESDELYVSWAEVAESFDLDDVEESLIKQLHTVLNTVYRVDDHGVHLTRRDLSGKDER